MYRRHLRILTMVFSGLLVALSLVGTARPAYAIQVIQQTFEQVQPGATVCIQQPITDTPGDVQAMGTADHLAKFTVWDNDQRLFRNRDLSFTYQTSGRPLSDTIQVCAKNVTSDQVETISLSLYS